MSTFQLQTGRCEQLTPSKAPPILTPGDITPEALRAWELGCQNFFSLKGVTAGDQVLTVAGSLLDPHVQDWYSNNRARLVALSFSAFMTEVCKYWLPSTWAAQVCTKMLSSSQGTKAFYHWAVEVKSLNVLLCGSSSSLSEEHLHFHLESHMHADLAADYWTSKISEEKDYHAWIEQIHLLNEKCI
ncbi:hypothetical protein EDC04DRAFT_2581658 [Pisolithus marmoratus]|nr:hypothetical protein EDC04DRAFT_2581658 [Pisolithus marmoratus]